MARFSFFPQFNDDILESVSGADFLFVDKLFLMKMEGMTGGGPGGRGGHKGMGDKLRTDLSMPCV